MTEQIQSEIIKSFAYGVSIEEVAEFYGMSTMDAEKFAKEHSVEISEKNNQLKKDGWM